MKNNETLANSDNKELVSILKIFINTCQLKNDMYSSSRILVQNLFIKIFKVVLN